MAFSVTFLSSPPFFLSLALSPFGLTPWVEMITNYIISVNQKMMIVILQWWHHGDNDDAG